jgi:hypothetical protein
MTGVQTPPRSNSRKGFSNTLQIDWPQHASPAACYRPAVFYHFVRLIALVLPQERKEARVSEVFLFIYFYKLRTCKIA